MQKETKRLIIRNFQKEDLADFFEYISNEKVCTMSGAGVCKTIEKANKELKERIKKEDFFAIADKNTGKVIGEIYITSHYPLLFSPNKFDYRAAEISFMLSEKFWGNGFMTEALEEILKYLFKELKVPQVVYSYLDKNKASERILEKLNFSKAQSSRYTRQWIDGSESLIMESAMSLEDYNKNIKRRDYEKN